MNAHLLYEQIIKIANIFVSKIKFIIYNKPWYTLLLFIFIFQVIALDVEDYVAACFFLFIYYLYSNSNIQESVTSSLDQKFNQVEKEFYSYLFILESICLSLHHEYNKTISLTSSLHQIINFSSEHIDYIKKQKYLNYKFLILDLIKKNLDLRINQYMLVSKYFKNTLLKPLLYNVLTLLILNIFLEIKKNINKRYLILLSLNKKARLNNIYLPYLSRILFISSKSIVENKDYSNINNPYFSLLKKLTKNEI
uniref:Uncharacterized protein orf251 n=1 Tax=Glaucocystis nostochinearum TaxID=38271 RepID=E9P6D6_9EUKA|nr:hypothetical protein GlnoM_p20 [Glaucocystis nostochinearum]ADW83120.1 hypothetical protein [Glaucocystis nostochinearum]